MIAPWYQRAYNRIEREIQQTLEQLVGDAYHVTTTTPKSPPMMCGGPQHKIFEVYDAHDNNLAARVRIGILPQEKPARTLAFQRTDKGITIQGYNGGCTKNLKELAEKVGDVHEKVEHYAKEYLALSKKLNELGDKTILRTRIDAHDFLRPHAQKLYEAGRNAVIEFYNEAQWNQKGIAEAFGITEDGVKNLVALIRAQLPQEYLDLEKQLAEF